MAENDPNANRVTDQIWAMWNGISQDMVSHLDDADTVEIEADQWNQLEGWVLTEHSHRVRAMSQQVARLEVMMRSYNATLEGQFRAAGEAFYDHIEARVEAVVDAALQAELGGVRAIADAEDMARLLERGAAYTFRVDHRLGADFAEKPLVQVAGR